MPLDFVEGSITLDYAEKAAAGAGISYTDYEHEADLAAGATYTPPTSTLFVFYAESFSNVTVNLEWYNNVDSAWTMKVSVEDEKILFSQSTSQHLRIKNDAGTAKAIGVYGVTWSGYAAYEYEADLASTATYTPPALTFFCYYAQAPGQLDNNVEWYDNVNSTWRCVVADIPHYHRMHQSTNQRLRLINDDPATAYAIGLYGETWS